MATLSPSEVRTVIDRAGGTLFSIQFVKRSNGELRTMVCRRGVTSHLRGGEQSYDPTLHGLCVVYDVASQGYRSIPLDSVVWVRVRGVTYDGPRGSIR